MVSEVREIQVKLSRVPADYAVFLGKGFDTVEETFDLGLKPDIQKQLEEAKERAKGLDLRNASKGLNKSCQHSITHICRTGSADPSCGSFLFLYSGMILNSFELFGKTLYFLILFGISIFRFIPFCGIIWLQKDIKGADRCYDDNR